MKSILVFLVIGLASGGLSADVGRRMRRELSFDWLWNLGRSSTEERNLPEETPGESAVKTRCSLPGVWYNSLGSEMILNVSNTDGHLTGEYRTAVERDSGSAGNGASHVNAFTSPTGDHSTFAMVVVWSNGRSTSSWTGQCHMCDKEETLMTTWILTSEKDHCDKYWMSNRIGQDVFKRYEQKEGPRRHDNTHTPRDVEARREREQAGQA